MVQKLIRKNSYKKESVLTEDYKDLKDTNTYKLLDDTKSELKEYSDAIYEPFGELHLTPYYLIGMYVSNSTKLEELDQYPYLIKMTYISRLSEQLFGKIHKNLKKIKETYVKVEPVLSNPLVIFLLRI